MSELHAHRNALPAGFQLEKYHIDSILGHGGFGITYLARDNSLERWVAIKEYLPNDTAVREGVSTVYPKSTLDETSFRWGMERFIQEAQTLAKLHHPNVVQVLDFFEAHHTAYMVMEYHEGETLSERLKQGTLDEQALLDIILPLMDGLETVHRAGFLHRDIKPGNILLRKDGHPVLLDFGAARFALGQRSTTLTSIVTPGYAPFEQYDDKSEQGAWTDIYALGAVMYHAVTGAPPREVVGRLKQDDMPRAVEVGAKHYNKSLLQAIDWALALDEEARPQTIQQWQEMITAPPLSGLSTKSAHAKATRAEADRWYHYFLWILVTLVLGIPGIYLLYQEAQHPGTIRHLAGFEHPQSQLQITQADLSTLIGRYFAGYEQGDVDMLMPLYGNRVDYYRFGLVGKAIIEEDKTAYFKNWRSVTYQLISPPELVDTDKVNEKRVFLHVTFSAKKVGKTSRGKAEQEWLLRKDADGLKIIKERQTVYKRKHQNKDE
ncbi:serine/threonine-protein kinase [Candidatus Venteria ishoeyi]|uniref:serine/threonine protein kinase n=1 Tax=Candidatus Venteria ishoeyi TaxID=1899563 RepID=UPI0025A51B67|nr:serine/threonine-protein kinase [Candidatus Venteria ishoeyi]MDM8547276.1 serine/threonine-protein kinase [Candidatus Venteria ishoeyi]